MPWVTSSGCTRNPTRSDDHLAAVTLEVYHELCTIIWNKYYVLACRTIYSACI